MQTKEQDSSKNFLFVDKEVHAAIGPVCSLLYSSKIKDLDYERNYTALNDLHRSRINDILVLMYSCIGMSVGSIEKNHAVRLQSICSEEIRILEFAINKNLLDEETKERATHDSNGLKMLLQKVTTLPETDNPVLILGCSESSLLEIKKAAIKFSKEERKQIRKDLINVLSVYHALLSCCSATRSMDKENLAKMILVIICLTMVSIAISFNNCTEPLLRSLILKLAEFQMDLRDPGCIFNIRNLPVFEEFNIEVSTFRSIKIVTDRLMQVHETNLPYR